jgi:hypothetical protein
LVSPATTVSITIPPPPAPQITNSVSNTTNGFQLKFGGLTNGSYSVYGSTNLATWQLLGGATQISPGLFRFTDPAATNTPRRFYRVSIP